MFCNFVLRGQTRPNHQSDLHVCVLRKVHQSVQGASEGSGSGLPCRVQASFPNLQRAPSLLNHVLTSRGICTQSARILQRQRAIVSQQYSASPRKLLWSPYFTEIPILNHNDDHPVPSCRVVFRPALKSPGMQCLSPISSLLETKSAFLTSSADDSHPHSVWETVFQAMGPHMSWTESRTGPQSKLNTLSLTVLT